VPQPLFAFAYADTQAEGNKGTGSRLIKKDHAPAFHVVARAD